MDKPAKIRFETRLNKHGHPVKIHIHPCAACKTGEIRRWSNRKNKTGKCKNCYLKGPRAKTRPYQSTYKMILKSARENDVPCNLTYNQFLKFVEVTQCFYCDEPIQWFPYSYAIGIRVTRHNLDRKDSKKGYTRNNLVVCCKGCNFAKRDMSANTFYVLRKLSKALNEIGYTDFDLTSTFHKKTRNKIYSA